MMRAPVVLLVDDSPTIGKVVGHTLRRHGIAVVTAMDEAAALAALATGQPQLVLLDIGLPTGDGLQLCRTIRNTPAYHHLPIVILSGRDGPLDRLRGRVAGASAYLSKPFEPFELVETVRAKLHLSGAARLMLDAGSSLIVPVGPR